MKRVILLFLALTALTVCQRVVAAGGKPLVEEKRAQKGFERIELLGDLDVVYRQGKTWSVVVKAPRQVIREVETTVKGNKLVVNMRGEGKLLNLGVADGDDVTVVVTSPDLVGVELKGSGDVDCRGRIDTDNLDVVVNGSGDVDFDDIVCDRLKVTVTGSGDVEAKRVKAQQTLLKVVGSGDVEMAFNNSGTVDARVKGSGSVKLVGRVKSLKHQVKGSGTIDYRRLIVKE